MNKVIIDLAKHNNKAQDFANVYISLSRVRSLKDLLILRPFSKEVLQIEIPEDLILVMQRLESLETETLKNIDKIINFN